MLHPVNDAKPGGEKIGKTLTTEEKKEKYRKIFEILHEEPRIYPKEAAKKIGMKQNIFRPKLLKALRQKYSAGLCIKW